VVLQDRVRARRMAWAFCISVAAQPCAAHHYFASTFDTARPVQITGTLTRIEWTNPHAHFYVDVTETGGAPATWVCEGAAPGALARRGLKRGDIQPGDTLIVEGFHAKGDARTIIVRRLTLPDGRVISSALSAIQRP
jgi:hypothetical protein